MMFAIIIVYNCSKDYYQLFFYILSINEKYLNEIQYREDGYDISAAINEMTI